MSNGCHHFMRKPTKPGRDPYAKEGFLTRRFLLARSQAKFEADIGLDPCLRLELQCEEVWDYFQMFEDEHILDLDTLPWHLHAQPTGRSSLTRPVYRDMKFQPLSVEDEDLPDLNQDGSFYDHEDPYAYDTWVELSDIPDPDDENEIPRRTHFRPARQHSLQGA